MGLFNNVIKGLYDISRTTGKAASKLNTVKTIMSGDPEKIAKHLTRKAVYKTSNKVARKINKNFK